MVPLRNRTRDWSSFSSSQKLSDCTEWSYLLYFLRNFLISKEKSKFRIWKRHMLFRPMEEHIRTLNNHTSSNGFQTTLNHQSAIFHQRDLRWTATFVGNSTAIQEMFKRVARAIHSHVQSEIYLILKVKTPRCCSLIVKTYYPFISLKSVKCNKRWISNQLPSHNLTFNDDPWFLQEYTHAILTSTLPSRFIF